MAQAALRLCYHGRVPERTPERRHSREKWSATLEAAQEILMVGALHVTILLVVAGILLLGEALLGRYAEAIPLARQATSWFEATIAVT